MRATGTVIAISAAVALVMTVTACGADREPEQITLGYLPSWADGLSTAYLLENQLEELGYEVEHLPQSDAGALYTGLAQGEIDLYPSAWPEATHRGYMDRYGEDIEDLGAYYTGATLNLSVPSYVDDVDSIADLADQSERFGNTVYAIEPGAGLTRATREDVLPGYGLDEDYEIHTSSTEAMLERLSAAIEANEDIVVTMWTPFWASTEFEVKQLDDPHHLFGDEEDLHFLARRGFTEEFPEAAEWIRQIRLDEKAYSELEGAVVIETEKRRHQRAVEEWLSRNPDVLPELPGPHQK